MREAARSEGEEGGGRRKHPRGTNQGKPRKPQTPNPQTQTPKPLFQPLPRMCKPLGRTPERTHVSLEEKPRTVSSAEK